MKLGWRFAPAPTPADATPDWQAARPASIERSLAAALERPTGGWFALDASRRFGARPRRLRVEGRELVVWRDGDALRAAPDECPHMGASLATGCVRDGRLVCPWHGLALGPEGHGAWKPFPTHDDGVLAWVRLPGETPLDAPVLPERPSPYLDGVVRIEARCAPRDVLGNRLDPWHGAHFHPYSFGALEVLEDTEEALLLQVEKRVAGRLRVAVEARFHCPSARCITMTILSGEGRGSVVETHATPIDDERTAIVEATLAGSDREGFKYARLLAPLIRPFIERSARRLWVDDAAYAEQLAELRRRGWRRGRERV
jgi:isorenieratene synthase